MNFNADLFFDARAQLGEGPVWWDGKLWFVDILGQQVCWLDDLKSGKIHRQDVGAPVGAMVPRDSGGFVLALKDRFVTWNPDSGVLDTLAKIGGLPAHMRLNDGKCDPCGRFFAGTMDTEGKPPCGKLYMLDSGNNLSEQLGGIAISNGLAWDVSGTTFYYIDTPTHTVSVFDYDAEKGALGQLKSAFEISGRPDGMTIDTDGNLWIAIWGGWGVGCWDPRSGKQRHWIDVPAENVTCPTFGGPNLDQLFISTARLNRSEENLKNQPYAGGIFICDPGVRGRMATSFAG